MRHIARRERRAPARRAAHAVAPAHRVADPRRGDPGDDRACTPPSRPTVYLSLFARVDGLDAWPTSTGRCTTTARWSSSWRCAAPLFVFPRDLLPAAWGSASARVAAAAGRPAGQGGRERRARRRRRRLAATPRAPRCSAGSADGAADGTASCASRCPTLDGAGRPAPGKALRRPTSPIAPRVLGPARRQAPIVRGAQRRPLADLAAAVDARCRAGWASDAGAAPERRGVRRAGARAGCAPSAPAPRPTSVWWLGATKAAVRRRWPTSGPWRSSLDGGETGWVLPDDLDAGSRRRAVGRAAARARPDDDGLEAARLLPRPTHVPHLFDTNGNAGTTAWWDGRVVGCWVQDDDGVVAVALARGRRRRGRARALDAEAARLTDVAGRRTRVGTVYPSPR